MVDQTQRAQRTLRFMSSSPKRVFQPIAPDVEKVGKAILDAAFKVHTALGPGLLESVYETTTAYEAQIMTYLRLSGVRLGFLINFNVKHLKDGIKRFVV